MKIPMINKSVMLITGTSKGIGKKLANYYLENGYIVIGCSRSGSDISSTNYIHYSLNLCDEASVKNMFKKIRKVYGRLDILINNAGLSAENYVLLTTMKKARELMDVNFVGTLLFCRESVKIMKLNHYGRIINISSIHVPLGTQGSSIYGSTKAAVEQFSKVLSQEIFHLGITVNVVSLSIVKDIGMEKKLTKNIKDNILNQTISMQPIKIEDVTNTVNFLIDDKSKMICNQTMYLGGKK